MNPNTMTLDECRDWLAKDAGWTFRSAVGNHWWEQSEGDPGTTTHPIPATLDEAAKLPERYTWAKHKNFSGTKMDGIRNYKAYDNRSKIVCVVEDTGDEKLDRFRLRVACVMHEKGIK